jgi:hypothetical protein
MTGYVLIVTHFIIIKNNNGEGEGGNDAKMRHTVSGKITHVLYPKQMLQLAFATVLAGLGCIPTEASAPSICLRLLTHAWPLHELVAQAAVKPRE